MNRFLNKIHRFVEKIGKRNFILILFVFIVLVITSLYQTFSLYSEYVGMSIVDGVKTYTFILGASNETNTITIAAGEIKYVDITVSNENEADLLYKLYYSSNNDLSDVDVIYLPDTMCLPDGEIKGNNSCIVKLRVKNYSENDISFNFGVKYGFKSGGDLVLDTNEYDIDINYMKSLFQSVDEHTYYRSDTYRENIKNASFVKYIETDTSKMVASWDVSAGNDASIVVWLENNTESGYYDLYIGSDKTIYSRDLTAFFAELTNLENISFENLDTSLVTDMDSMFANCISLTTLDLSNFDTSNVITMNYMFGNCEKLTSLNVSSFDASNVVDMQYMFYSCYELTNLDLNGFDTSNVIRMDYMFYECAKLSTVITISNAGVEISPLMISGAAIVSGAKITINYTVETSALVEELISPESISLGSNVVKGSLVD